MAEEGKGFFFILNIPPTYGNAPDWKTSIQIKMKYVGLLCLSFLTFTHPLYTKKLLQKFPSFNTRIENIFNNVKNKHKITFTLFAAARKSCLPAEITQKTMKSSNNWTFYRYEISEFAWHRHAFYRDFLKIGTEFASCRVLRDIVPSVACPMLSNDANFFSGTISRKNRCLG